jgi:uncharacterized protein (DUF427 family)
MPERERVADYPRPPRVEADPRRIRIVHGGRTIVDITGGALRVLETASPPTFYVPVAAVREPLTRVEDASSFCEWKGAATYWSLPDAPQCAWGYDHPFREYVALLDHVAFYASRVDECWVDDERVTPQPGRYYGGWITSEVEGPFKGEPGTEHW